ncbi:hypothetical protein [Marinitoga lauensis]|uniref:hypothetical protein n=1 Tax=Marinitoga lauensis TaxID=2201189 RepID=UPI001010E61C|nr:hypothetical protein [Marinitoga lauensis]
MKNNYRVKEIIFLAINEEYLKNKGDYIKVQNGLSEIGVTEESIIKYLKIPLEKYLKTKFLKNQMNYYKKTVPYF